MQHKFLTSNWLHQCFYITGLIMLFGILSFHFGQDANWDLKDYHFYNAYAFLHHRLDWDFIPAQKHNFYNPIFELLNYYIINYFSDPRWAQFTLGIFHGIAVYFLFKITCYVIKPEKKLWRYFCITLAIFLGVTGSASISQLGTTHNESQISVFIMAAVFLALKYINTNQSQKIYLCLLSGLVLGLGVGFKLTAVSYPLAFFIALLFYKKPDKQHIKLVFLTGIFFSLGFFTTAGFWMWVMYKHFHNPFFPYYNNIFHSPYLPHKSFADRDSLPKSFWFALIYPFYWLHKNTMVEFIPMADARIAVTLALSILFICYAFFQKLTNKAKEIYVTEKNQSIKFVCLFFYLSYFTWLFEFSVYRFTIPLNFISGILIIYFCLKLFRPIIIQLLAMLIISALLLKTTVYPDWGRKSYDNHFFEVQAPPITKGAMVILLGASPISYLIPFFPPETRFVALKNYFVNNSMPVFSKRAIEIIKNYQGPLYVLVDQIGPNGSTKDFRPAQKNTLKQYGLLRLDEMCGSIVSNMEDAPISLCAVVKKS